MEEKEGSLDYFINEIIKSEPKSERSIQLEILNEEKNTDTIFNFLVEVFTKIAKKLYSNSSGIVNLDNIDIPKLNKIEKYFKSFGMQFFVEKSKINNEVVYTNDTKRTYKNNELNQNCLNIKSSFKYKIYFDYL